MAISYLYIVDRIAAAAENWVPDLSLISCGCVETDSKAELLCILSFQGVGDEIRCYQHGAQWGDGTCFPFPTHGEG